MDDETLDFFGGHDRADREYAAQPERNAQVVPPGERECPICKRKMQAEFEYQIHVDVCPDHGIWLDASELPAILDMARTEGRKWRDQAVKRAFEEGKRGRSWLSMLFEG